MPLEFLQSWFVPVQVASHDPNTHAGIVAAGSPTAEHLLPHAEQLFGSFCRFTHAVGFTLGQALETEPLLGAQVPLGIPVALAAQPMHIPPEEDASAQVDPQQI